ncbi:hypothetical protein OH492_09275 [Vibrio chagasii]|nr:hypothetical protein [Vibrio chagasii]
MKVEGQYRETGDEANDIIAISSKHPILNLNIVAGRPGASIVSFTPVKDGNFDGFDTKHTGGSNWPNLGSGFDDDNLLVGDGEQALCPGSGGLETSDLVARQ